MQCIQSCNCTLKKNNFETNYGECGECAQHSHVHRDGRDFEIKIPYSYNNIHSNVFKNPTVMCSMVSHESFLLLFRLQFVILQLLLKSFST